MALLGDEDRGVLRFFYFYKCQNTVKPFKKLLLLIWSSIGTQFLSYINVIRVRVSLESFIRISFVKTLLKTYRRFLK